MASTTSSILAAMALVQTGSAFVLDLPIWFRTTYALVNLPVGTPPQEHLLLFDTGSGSSWIADKKCADEVCKNTSGFSRNGYDIDASSTGEDLGVYDSVDYLGGKTGGPAVSDKFQLGDASWNQSFIAANDSSWSFIPGDGFFGMSFSSIAQPSTQTIVETMMEGGLLDEPKFAIYYGKEFNFTEDGEGVLTLGGSKEDQYVEGEMTWLPVRKDQVANGTAYQLWRSTLRQVSGRRDGSADDGGQSFNGSVEFAAGKANGVFDTGAGTVSLPTQAVSDVYKSIGWDYEALLNGDFLPLCTDFNSTWSVTFTFSDDDVNFFNMSVSGDQLARNGFAGRDDACVPPFDDSESEGLALIGQSFIRRFYTVFDYGATNVEDFKPRIGFGQLKKEYQPPAVNA
ncbi:pepsinogen c [Astrocystis sublimbata]|nr:pepsinogen c [Astrocystis sublimbata]